MLQEHGDDNADHHGEDSRQIHQADAGKALSLGDVTGGAAHEITGFGLVVKGKGQILHTAVKVVAQIIGDAMAQPFAIVALPKGDNPAHHRNSQDQAAGPKEYPRIARRHPFVNGVGDNLGDKEADQRCQCHRQIGNDDLAPIGL